MGKNKPAHEIKVGRIRVAIWANETDEKEIWFNATISRLYKAGDAWKESSSFGRDDLPIVSKAMDMAHHWMLRKQMQLQRKKVKSVVARAVG